MVCGKNTLGLYRQTASRQPVIDDRVEIEMGRVLRRFYNLTVEHLFAFLLQTNIKVSFTVTYLTYSTWQDQWIPK